MRVLSLANIPTLEVIREVVSCLQSGGLVVYPTETTYGIGADATNQAAVNKLLQYKKRRGGKPLSLVVADEEMAAQYVELNDAAGKVYKTFMPGPVTVVSRGKHAVAKGIESELGTLGIRIPAYPLVLDIVRAFGKPITATGANASYKKRPYSVKDVLDNISEKQKGLIDLILDAGELPHNEPSTVVDTTMEEIAVLRQGKIAFTESQKTNTHSAEETQELGRRLILKYKNYLSHKAIVFCLEGEMGAGKTQFTKGIAKALGIRQEIVSPTYTISREYKFEGEGKKLEFVHIDTWRFLDAAEFEALGFERMVDQNFVIAIEWAGKAQGILERYKDEAKIIWVKFEYGEKENDRNISFSDRPFER